MKIKVKEATRPVLSKWDARGFTGYYVTKAGIVEIWVNGERVQTYPSVEAARESGERIGEAHCCEAFNPKTVTIGDQVWMSENLAVDDGGDGIYRNPGSGEYFYTWKAAKRVAKSIPGWHLPTAKEWDKAALADAQGLKDKLGVELAGRWYDGTFYYAGKYAYFWTASVYISSNALSYFFGPDTPVHRDFNDKTLDANSVRLVKD